MGRAMAYKRSYVPNHQQRVVEVGVVGMQGLVLNLTPADQEGDSGDEQQMKNHNACVAMELVPWEALFLAVLTNNRRLKQPSSGPAISCERDA